MYLKICHKCLDNEILDNPKNEKCLKCNIPFKFYDSPNLLTILHADMDAFFANVEILDNPKLKGKPVIVGGDIDQRSVVSTCSYEARKYGVKSAMPIKKAHKLCPHGIFILPNMNRYIEISKIIFEIIESFTPSFEPLSIDEAFLDMKGTNHIFGHPIIAAIRLKKQIKEKTGITISVGVAHNKFLAKLGSDENKPDGLFIITPKTFQKYLDDLPIEKMWGIGKASYSNLKRSNIKTIKDLRECNKDKLKILFKNQWNHFYNLSRGIDERKVIKEHAIKSVGNERTFSKDLKNIKIILTELWYLCEKVARRLNRKQLKGKTLTLKIRTHNFKLITRSKTFSNPLHIDLEIFKNSKFLLEKIDLINIDIRLLGISISNFYNEKEDKQLNLFTSNFSDLKKENLNNAINKIKDKFGDKLITRGIGIKENSKFKIRLLSTKFLNSIVVDFCAN